ncbi:MAG: NTP transferase domain-containing protein [Niabella sp.]|nr:NTP transferase domain-containing protein [Niabella sp.]
MITMNDELSTINSRPSPSGAGGLRGMIFCAGLGTRFKPWTDQHPKALAVINGKSLLQRNVEYLQQYGIKQLVVNVHHFADQIVEAIKEHKGWGSEITISDETDAVLETGGGLLKAKPLFTPGEKFITCNADILTDLDISQLIAFHEANKPLISMAVGDRKTSRYLLFDENNTLCGWRNIATGEEKIARPADTLIQKSYDCVVVFEYEVFNHIPFTGKFSLIDLYLHLAKTHTIKGFQHHADRWIDVGKPESVAPAEQLFRDL